MPPRSVTPVTGFLLRVAQWKAMTRCDHRFFNVKGASRRQLGPLIKQTICVCGPFSSDGAMGLPFPFANVKDGSTALDVIGLV